MKDYYQILGVPPDAQTSEIRAAYLELIKKHHPDLLDFSRRDDPEILRMVQELNEAYAALVDEERRHCYDDARRIYKDGKRPLFTVSKEFEQRIYLVKCGVTKRSFRMFLARRRDTSTPWSVLGFEPLEEKLQTASATIKDRGLKTRWSEWLASDHVGRRFNSRPPHKSRASLVTGSNPQIRARSGTLTMGDIDWNLYTCPDCGSKIRNPNGSFATWVGCSTCGHIMCAGSTQETRRGFYATCPWCGTKKKVTRSVALRKKDRLAFTGELKGKSSTASSSDNPDFEAKKPHKLESGEE
jgi:curved DNA-binding protein CbpA